jgi:hypothetical protein
MIKKYSLRIEIRDPNIHNRIKRFNITNHYFYISALVTKLLCRTTCYIFRQSNYRLWIEKTKQYRKNQELKNLNKICNNYINYINNK